MRSGYGLAKLALSLLVLTIMAAAPAAASSLVDVELADRAAVERFYAAGFDVAEVTEGGAVIVAAEGDLQRLAALGLPHTVRIPQLEQYYADRLDSELDDMGGYATWGEVAAWVDSITAARPDLVAGPDTLGMTLHGRPVRVIKISDNPGTDEEETEIFVNAAIHAREVITPLILMHFAELLLAGYDQGEERATAIVENSELWLLPVFNADGYHRNGALWPDGGGMQRKNVRYVDGVTYSDSTQVGVDLNRNWGYQWGLNDDGSSSNPLSGTYRGASAFSEPATQVVRDFINGRSFAGVLNYHSYGNLLLYPWGHTHEAHPWWETYELMAGYIVEPIEYWAGPSIDLYETNGDAGDWIAAGGLPDGPDYQMYGFTFEVGSSSDGFWPSLARKDVLIQEHEEPLLRFCEVMMDPTFLGAPLAPSVELPDTLPTSFELVWHPAADTTTNAAVIYDAYEIWDRLEEDDAETNAFGVVLNGFQRTTNDQHEGSFSYYSGSANRVNRSWSTLFPWTVQESDTLAFWARWDIEDYYDWAYVEISVDGGPFGTLEGNVTTTNDPHGSSRGHGITGTNENWTRCTFPLPDSAVGREAVFRVSYITDSYVSEEGFYFDDLSPFNGFAGFAPLALETGDTTIQVDHPELTEATEYSYAVRAYDEQGDMSPWSSPESTVLSPDYEAVQADPARPLSFAVEPVAPNPFNPSARVAFSLPEGARVRITVHDLLGRTVAELDRGALPAGRHAALLDGSRWASGLYLVTVQARTPARLHSATRKAVLMK